MRPQTTDNISELAPLLKTRTPLVRDPHSMKAQRGFKSHDVPPGRRPLRREFARKR